MSPEVLISIELIMCSAMICCTISASVTRIVKAIKGNRNEK